MYTYRSSGQTLPRERNVFDVRRNGHHKVQCVLVDLAVAHVIQFSGEACMSGTKKENQTYYYISHTLYMSSAPKR